MTGKKYGIQRKAPARGKALRAALCLLAVLWGLFSMGLGSYRVARLCGFHPGLGGPMFTVSGVPVYSPLKVLSWQSTMKRDKAIGQMADQAFMMALGGPMLIAMAAMAMASGPRGREDLHGSARWAGREDIMAMGYLGNEGVYVGGWWDERRKVHVYLRHDGPEHVLVFAPTRSGKGVGLILPTLLAWEHSSVVLDIKGENFALTSGYLAGLGHKTIRFDPSDAEGTSAAYNPFEEIGIDSPMCVPDIQRVSSMIMDPQGKGLEDYWNKAAFGFLGGALLHCMIRTRREEGRAATFLDVAMMLEDPGIKPEDRKPRQLYENMVNYDHAGVLGEMFPGMPADWRRSCRDFVASAASGMLGKADNELSGVVNTATSNLALYKDPVVAMNTSRCDFRMDDLMNHERPVNLYLAVSPADIDRLRPLLRILVAQLLNRLTGRMDFEDGASVARYRHRLLLLLDEFTSLGKIPIVERAVAYMAGYGVKGYFIVQDTKQLAQAYGQDNALMANCHTRIAYAPNLPETAEYLSRMLGQTTVVDRKASISRSRTGSSRSISVAETARPLLTPGECMALPGMTRDHAGNITPGDMLIITAGNRPIYGRQILHFMDPVFSARAKVPVPGLGEGRPRGISDSLHWPMPNAAGTPAQGEEPGGPASPARPRGEGAPGEEAAAAVAGPGTGGDGADFAAQYDDSFKEAMTRLNEGK
ncbi:MAG: type IV secretory system conjugative DNA transfer family protein [Deltaproteobacteria bacterium]|nr:type IV secretory system conjugative DNA transfer family protein [Deltaproteobacteria bacterium]